MGSIVNPKIVPQRDFRVRRRRNDGLVWLNLLHQYFELDERTDAVWEACNGRRNFEAIVNEVTTKLNETPQRSEKIARLSIEMFLEAQLLTLREEKIE